MEEKRVSLMFAEKRIHSLSVNSLAVFSKPGWCVFSSYLWAALQTPETDINGNFDCQNSLVAGMKQHVQTVPPLAATIPAEGTFPSL